MEKYPNFLFTQSHTHGIPNYTQLPEFRAITSFKKTPFEQIELFINKPLDFEPGVQYVYNNSGYVVLGYLIELLSGLTIAVLSNLNTFGYVWDIGFLAQQIALKLLLAANNREVMLPREKKPIVLDDHCLQQCVGEYEIKEYLKLVVTASNGQLAACFSNQQPIPLYAEKDLSFYALIPDLEFKFLTNKTGQVTHVQLSQSGYELTAAKK